MPSYMVGPPKNAGQADLRFPAILVGPEIHLLVLYRMPQALDQSVVKAALQPRPDSRDV
jgi:hypothetical protein